MEKRGLGRSPNRRHSPMLNKNVMSCSVACIRYSPSFAMPSSRGGRSEAQQNPPRCACHSCWACWVRCTITSTSSVQLVTLVTSFNASDFSHLLIGGAPTLKLLKCSETQGITSSSTAKCNITTLPQLAPQSFPSPAAGGGAPRFLNFFFIFFVW